MEDQSFTAQNRAVGPSFSPQPLSPQQRRSGSSSSSSSSSSRADSAAALKLWELRQRYHEDDREVLQELLEKFNRKCTPKGTTPSKKTPWERVEYFAILFGDPRYIDLFKRLKREELKNATGGRNRCYDSLSKLLNRSSFSKSQKARSEQRASALSYTPKPFTKEEENALVLIMREEVPRDAERYYIQRSQDRCIAWSEVSKRFDEITGGCDRPESSLQTKWNSTLRWKFSEDLKLGELVRKHTKASEGQGSRNYTILSEVDWEKVLRDFKDDSLNPTIVKRRAVRLGLVRKKEASKSLGRPRVRPRPVAIYSDRLSASGLSDIRLKNRYSKVEYARIFEGNAYSFIFDLHSRQDSTNPCYDMLAPVFTLFKTELEPKREPIDPQDTAFLVTLHLSEWKAVKVCLENYVFTAERHRKLFKRCLINWLFPGSRPPLQKP